MRRPFLALGLFVLLAPAWLRATCIVVFRSPERVIFAGDSLATVADSTGHAKPQAGDCKIRPAGGRWWYIVGGYSNGVDTIVTHALAPTTTLPAALVALDAAYKTSIRANLELAASNTAAASALGWAKDQPILNVLVAGVDSNNSPIVGALLVDIASLAPVTFTAATAQCPGRLCPADDNRLYFSASQQGPAVNLIRQTPRPAWLEHGDAEAARRLINLQITATPKDVAGPIDLLQIDSAGARWIGRDPDSACAAIQP